MISNAKNPKEKVCPKAPLTPGSRSRGHLFLKDFHNLASCVTPCAVVILLVFIFFYKTIFYGIKSYDELVTFKETYLPVCFSFSEMLELISLLGLNQHFEATNTLYSNISSLRCNPAGNLLQMIVGLICKKNPVHYHLYSLIFHLINCCLVFLILNRVSLGFCKRQLSAISSANFRLLVVSTLTLLWAIHPVNIEPILLLTNGNVIFSYTLCFLTILIYLNSFSSDFKPNKLSLLKSLLLFFLFLGVLFIVEYHFILPFILIAYTSAMMLYWNYKSAPFLKSFFICFRSSLVSTIPLLASTFLFMLYFFLSNARINISSQSSCQIILERVFWLSPQILLHLTKLVFLPIKLSIDQTFLVKLAKSLFDPYSIFCFVVALLVICFSVISFANANKKFPFIFIIFFPFLLSLLPFSQILAPIYNLASERYLYFPTFILVFGLAHLVFSLSLSIPRLGSLVLVLLFILLSAYGSRAYIRVLDWQNSFSLYNSAIKATNDPLYKAYRYKGLLPQEKIFARYPEKEADPKYKKLAIKNLKKAIKKLKEEKEKYQSRTPQIIKSYGLDPASLLAKAGYILAQTDSTLNNDYKRSLQLIRPFVKDLSFLDSAGLSFYASLLFYNKMIDKTEEVLKLAHRKNPHALRVIYPLCDLIQIKYGDLQEVEKYTLKAFNYFPYDTFTLLVLTKIYKLKADFNNYAHFSYIYGLRHHSIEDLENARKVYLLLNKQEKAKQAEKRIYDLKKRIRNLPV